MVKFRSAWDGGWRVWRDGKMVGALVQYSNGKWSVRAVIPEPFDLDTPIRTNHLAWQDSFRQAKAFAALHFA